MEIKTIYCNVVGCEESHTEKVFDMGHPEWGHIEGREDRETGETRAHLCPKHLALVFSIISGGK